MVADSISLQIILMDLVLSLKWNMSSLQHANLELL